MVHGKSIALGNVRSTYSARQFNKQLMNLLYIHNDLPVERARDIVVHSYGPLFVSLDTTHGETIIEVEFVRRHSRLGEDVNCHFRAKPSDISIGDTIINSHVNDKLTIGNAFVRTTAIGLMCYDIIGRSFYFGCNKLKVCLHIREHVIIANNYKLRFNYWHHFPGLGIGERKHHIACFEGDDLKRAIMFDREGEVDFEDRIRVTYLDSRSTAERLGDGQMEVRDVRCERELCEHCQAEDEQKQERERLRQLYREQEMARQAEQVRQVQAERKRAHEAEEKEWRERHAEDEMKTGEEERRAQQSQMETLKTQIHASENSGLHNFAGALKRKLVCLAQSMEAPPGVHSSTPASGGRNAGENIGLGGRECVVKLVMAMLEIMGADISMMKS
jgi:hypothetical protein